MGARAAAVRLQRAQDFASGGGRPRELDLLVYGNHCLVAARGLRPIFHPVAPARLPAGGPDPPDIRALYALAAGGSSPGLAAAERLLVCWVSAAFGRLCREVLHNRRYLADRRADDHKRAVPLAADCCRGLSYVGLLGSRG